MATKTRKLIINENQEHDKPEITKVFDSSSTQTTEVERSVTVGGKMMVDGDGGRWMTMEDGTVEGSPNSP